MHTFSFVIFATSLFWPAAASAQLNVLMSGGFSGAYEQLLPEFERTSGIKVTTGSGASQGAGPQTIAAQLARGVPANVVILPREGLSELIAAKRIVAIQPPFRQVLPLCDHAILRASTCVAVATYAWLFGIELYRHDALGGCCGPPRTYRVVASPGPLVTPCGSGRSRGIKP